QKLCSVINHPAWKGEIDKQMSLILLKDQPAMSYLLRQDSASEYDFWLTYKNEADQILHRHFDIRKIAGSWMFANLGAPPCENLDGFIQGALSCTIWP